MLPPRFQLVQDAIDGAIGLFDDRYGNEVSVYKIGDVSKELCSGPHVANTREIGRFRIEKEQAVGSGVRRVPRHCELTTGISRSGADKTL